MQVCKTFLFYNFLLEIHFEIFWRYASINIHVLSILNAFFITIFCVKDIIFCEPFAYFALFLFLKQSSFHSESFAGVFERMLSLGLKVIYLTRLMIFFRGTVIQQLESNLDALDIIFDEYVTYAYEITDVHFWNTLKIIFRLF